MNYLHKHMIVCNTIEEYMQTEGDCSLLFHGCSSDISSFANNDASLSSSTS